MAYSHLRPLNFRNLESLLQISGKGNEIHEYEKNFKSATLTQRFTLLGKHRHGVGEDVTIVSDDRKREWNSDDCEKNTKQPAFKGFRHDVAVADCGANC